jgi:Glycoside Hydrolase Family 113
MLGSDFFIAGWRASGMKHPPWRNLSPALLIMVCVFARPCASAEAVPAPRLDGFNVIEAAGHPFGSASAKLALANAKHLGASAIAIIPFLWQPHPASSGVRRGDDMTDIELRAAIRDAHALGLAAIVKPHVWVPESWAGAIAMKSENDWRDWFANYRRALDPIARIAEEEKAEALAIGTELSQTAQQPQWHVLIGETRRIYSGRLLYVAHNVDEAEAVPFWVELDAIGVTLYPPLGADDDGDGRRNTMQAVAARLDAIAAKTGKSIVVAEIGLRSAVGAAAKPWESAEERASAPDPALQAQVLANWLAILDRPSIEGVLIWRWLTDPDAGGSTDTDFTVQDKPAERVLMCAWTRDCAQTEAAFPQ